MTTSLQLGGFVIAENPVWCIGVSVGGALASFCPPGFRHPARVSAVFGGYFRGMKLLNDTVPPGSCTAPFTCSCPAHTKGATCGTCQAGWWGPRCAKYSCGTCRDRKPITSGCKKLGSGCCGWSDCAHGCKGPNQCTPPPPPPAPPVYLSSANYAAGCHKVTSHRRSQKVFTTMSKCKTCADFPPTPPTHPPWWATHPLALPFHPKRIQETCCRQLGFYHVDCVRF